MREFIGRRLKAMLVISVLSISLVPLYSAFCFISPFNCPNNYCTAFSSIQVRCTASDDQAVCESIDETTGEWQTDEMVMCLDSGGGAFCNPLIDPGCDPWAY